MSPDALRTLFPDILHILIISIDFNRFVDRAFTFAGPEVEASRETMILRGGNDVRRWGEIDSRYVHEGDISRWHQKSEYETRRKLHDVIIVLWECLEWSEYHNTWCCTLWELLLQILQSTTVLLAWPSTPTWLSLVPVKPNFFVCSILSGHRAHSLHDRRVSAP